jgi:hypothetical protein
MNWKGFGRSSLGLIKILSWPLPGRTEKNHKEPPSFRTASVPAEI